MRKKPQYFDELYCNLVDAGEQAGALESLLARVATYKEKTEALKAKKESHGLSPRSTDHGRGRDDDHAAGSGTEIRSDFSPASVPSAAFHQMVIALSQALQQWWWVVLAMILGAVYGLRRGARGSPPRFATGSSRAAEATDHWQPAVQVRRGAIAATLSTTFAAGVPLVEALDSVAGATGNVVFRNAVNRVKQDVSTGMQLNFSMRTTGVFPTMAIQMTAIGEESGALDDMLDKVATYYEEGRQSGQHPDDPDGALDHGRTRHHRRQPGDRHVPPIFKLGQVV